MKNSTFIFVFLLSSVFSSMAAAGLPTSFKPGRLSLNVEAQYLLTSANFDKNGNEEDFADGNEYTNLTTVADGTYYFNGGWAASGGFAFALAESTTPSGLNPTEDRSNSELTDVHLKGQKLLSWRNMRFIPEVTALLALNEITDTQDDVYTSEGVNMYSLGSWIITDLSAVKLYGFLGYKFRDDGRSNLLPWNVGLAWRSSSFALLGEIGGYQTIEDDEDGDNHAREILGNNQVNGESLKYNSVNPSLTELRVQAHFAISRDFQVYGGISHALMGESMASGQTIIAGMTYNMDFGGGTSSDPRLDDGEVKPKRGRSVKDEIDQDFKPDVEQDYDDSLFEGSADGGN